MRVNFIWSFLSSDAEIGSVYMIIYMESYLTCVNIPIGSLGGDAMFRKTKCIFFATHAMKAYGKVKL